MSSLQVAEGVIKLGGNVLNAEKGSSSSRSVPKGKKEKKKAGTRGLSVGPVPKIAKFKGRGKEKGKECGRSRGKCFYWVRRVTGSEIVLSTWLRECKV